MAKVELTFISDNADLSRNENGQLVVHIVGAEDTDITSAISAYNNEIAQRNIQPIVQAIPTPDVIMEPDQPIVEP